MADDGAGRVPADLQPLGVATRGQGLDGGEPHPLAVGALVKIAVDGLLLGEQGRQEPIGAVAVHQEERQAPVADPDAIEAREDVARGRPGLGHLAEQALEGRVLEEGPQRNVEAQLFLQAGARADDQHGRGPQAEEIVVHPDAGHAQDLGPDVGEARLEGVAGRPAPRDLAGDRPRGRQGLAVDLAARGQRKGGQAHERRRDHVGRELPARVLEEGGSIRRLPMK